SGGREMIIGAHRDPVFGVAVVFGDGGKYVEAMPDLCLLLAPFSREQVLRRLGRLRMAPLIDGARGEPPLDAEAFADAVVAVGRWMMERPAIHSLDLNPVVMGALGEGCRALDAVLFEQEATADSEA